MRTKLARAARSAASEFADLVWPPRCFGCDLPGVLVCPSCAARMPAIDHAHACPRCGAPEGDEGCAECGRSDFAFAAARCAGVLEWPLSRAVTLFKDAGDLRIAAFLADAAATAAGEWAAWAQAVAFVPASPAAVARRGFDHGALLAAEFSALTGVPAIAALAARPRRDQRSLSREQRQANARASMRAVPGVAAPPRVLVLDDVFTTGATLDAAAAALPLAGAVEVRVVAVARACGGRM